jgi:hypothetical protein
MFGRLSLGTLGIGVGSVITLIGFGAYFFTDNATLNLAGFFYGIPLLLGGLALKSAELKPVPFLPPSPEEIIALRVQATPTQKQILNEVTRYRYGEEAHLSLALERLGLSTIKAHRPVLTSIREANESGAYSLILNFDSPHIGLKLWQEKQDKMTRFFGPNIQAKVNGNGSENQVEVTLTRVPD